MRDLNFFEPYIEKTEFKLDKKFIVAGICIFTFLSLSTYTIYNSMIIRKETRIVQGLKTTAEDPTRLKKVEDIKEREEEVNEFKGSVEKIRYLDKVLDERDIIHEDLLATITTRIPEDLFLTSLSIFNNEIQIVGVSKNKLSIAEFEKGLEDLGYMEDLQEIFISNISQEDDHYNFTINISLKDVDNYEDETAEEFPSEGPED